MRHPNDLFIAPPLLEEKGARLVGECDGLRLKTLASSIYRELPALIWFNAEFKGL